jgi:hypothetical protein
MRKKAAHRLTDQSPWGFCLSTGRLPTSLREADLKVSSEGRNDSENDMGMAFRVP